LANDKSTALEIGDEPMQFYQKFPEVPIAVGEQRITAIPLLLQDSRDIQVLLLDDAFQHRAIHPGFSILLSDYAISITCSKTNTKINYELHFESLRKTNFGFSWKSND
jgi:tetraacyldisaccharide-1-P 4'-kinase